MGSVGKTFPLNIETWNKEIFPIISTRRKMFESNNPFLILHSITVQTQDA